MRAVLFDLGGVFFLWPPADSFARWAAHFGMTSERLQQQLWYGPDIEAANVGAITAEEYARRAAQRLGSDPLQVSRLLEDAFAGEPLNQDLVTYTRTLRSRSRLRIAALTNTWSFGRTLLRRRGIADLFDLVVTSAEEGVTKPDPVIYQRTLERLGITPAEAVFVDDNYANVEAARALGMHGIQFVSTQQTIAALESLLTQDVSGRE